jgi:hypothetical protein
MWLLSRPILKLPVKASIGFVSGAFLEFPVSTFEDLLFRPFVCLLSRPFFKLPVKAFIRLLSMKLMGLLSRPILSSEDKLQSGGGGLDAFAPRSRSSWSFCEGFL